MSIEILMYTELFKMPCVFEYCLCFRNYLFVVLLLIKVKTSYFSIAKYYAFFNQQTFSHHKIEYL